ncbi:MAG: 5-formyltetrahydrofolate cyclo-ligase [Planctomycetaceae bacterium]|jgi:5-formyltetrahydrofolate cyclo-ligase
MTPSDVPKLKNQMRRTARSNRNALENRDELSRRIVGAFMALPEYATASVAMFYVGVGSEVQTRHDLAFALESDKTIVVPWCNVNGELQLFRLESIHELETGMYHIPEPRRELRELPEKQIDAEEPDVIMVPGVAFDERGARLGHGNGYYDKLLQRARADTSCIALAFECQVFEEIPVAPHDVFMDKMITEDRVLQGQGRGTVPGNS